MMNRAGVIFAAVIGVAGIASADTVYLRDGSVRHGVVESRDGSQLRLRIESDGISGSINIPMSQVARLVLEVNPPAPIASSDSRAPNPLAQTRPESLPRSPDPPASPPTTLTATPPSTQELASFEAHGFFRELLATAAGHGPDDVARLPEGARLLWVQAQTADTQKDRAQLLEILRALESSVRDLPQGIARLDAICRRQRQESFGFWMARVHWDVLGTHYGNGMFDLKDVREVERIPLIGLLKEKTNSSLEPLMAYFPAPDEKTGQPALSRPPQLQGITAGNALEVRDKASFAAAVLLAQLKLEPDMPPVDRGLLSSELGVVNRILARARDLEPAAKAAAIRAEQERRAAEEKARRDAAIAAQHRPGR